MPKCGIQAEGVCVCALGARASSGGWFQHCWKSPIKGRETETRTTIKMESRLLAPPAASSAPRTTKWNARWLPRLAPTSWQKTCHMCAHTHICIYMNLSVYLYSLYTHTLSRPSRTNSSRPHSTSSASAEAPDLIRECPEI